MATRPAAVRIPQALLTEHANRGARIRQLLRLMLVAFFAATLLTEPPVEHLAACWFLVGAYLVWGFAIYVLGTGDDTPRFLWLSLFADVAVLTTLTLISDSSAAISWTPYLIINGFFLIPVIAAAQLSPGVCAAVVVPTVLIYLGSGLLTQHVGQEPISYVLLRTFMLAAVGLGAIMLSRLQRSRVATIAGLLEERSQLLDDLLTLERRERESLAETLHDGALQYVLGARQELDDLPDPQAVQRIDEALTEAGRLLRGTLTQLHPAVLQSAGLPAALADLVEGFRSRGRCAVELVVDGWAPEDRTSGDDLLLGTARELLTNVAKHAAAQSASIRLTRTGDASGGQVARLEVTDDGRGIGDVDLGGRLAEGHLGLASRRIRIEAAGGRLELTSVAPHGTRARVDVPVVLEQQ